MNTHRLAIALISALTLVASCAGAPKHAEPAQPADASTQAWSADDYDVVVQITADAVLVDGKEVATHDRVVFDEGVERRDIEGLYVVPVSRAVSKAAKGAPEDASLAVVVDPAVGADLFTSVIYTAPSAMSVGEYALIVGDAPPVVVSVPDMGKLMAQEKLTAAPMLTLSPTWETMRLAAFMNVAKLGACVDDNTCGARATERRRWVSEARGASDPSSGEQTKALLNKLAASYDFDRAHAALNKAAEQAEELNKQPPRYLQVNLSGELPVSLYPEMFALRCANWSPGMVAEATREGRWECDAMVETIVVNIVR
ncbi:hypothetical protein FIV42_20730 [Persicimonas caeni]|uniref:Uncharacterized protein n=1 Tax=Persicimonas caeni TaxID=2292766 RepID=A0A4Y6PXM9_PERCE|nr:hypothetical protein [Persicimonas caeni]QDG53081.1 hypothetical protein FIV42_20730 [Persicimonas caeni]QED34303.1 hypothetical protein FRD00_20725 [Persicimonas caeni]